ncbi:MAG: DNA-binding domain-containing protein [Pseudomonadota bacterium]
MPNQVDFTSALLDPESAVPNGLVDPHGRPAERRFNIYRNNVAVSLGEALATGFPVLQKLLGQASFKALAGVFLRMHPPSSPLMMHYGREMPAFLQAFEPLAGLPYLADVARLELAMREAYHAKDAPALDPSRLGAIAPENLPNLRLSLRPATRVVRSGWPIYDIWAFNMIEGAPKPSPGSQDALIARAEFDPEPHLLPPGGGAFLAALSDGATLGEAADAGAKSAPAFDLSATLGVLLASGALEDILTEGSQA